MKTPIDRPAMRVGDFIEFTGQAARTVSPLVGLTMTRMRGVVLCGFPYHQQDAYAPKLLACGYRLNVTVATDRGQVASWLKAAGQ